MSARVGAPRRAASRRLRIFQLASPQCLLPWRSSAQAFSSWRLDHEVSMVVSLTSSPLGLILSPGVKGDAVQLAMTYPEWFQPVPGGSDHYVVALQSLTGELAALAHASTQTWARLTPLIQIRGPKAPRQEPYRAE